MYQLRETLLLNGFLCIAHSRIIVFVLIHPGCHNDAKGIESGSNSKMTDKYVAEYSKIAYLCLN